MVVGLGPPEEEARERERGPGEKSRVRGRFLF
jgi:hypothetical protein